MGEPNFENMFAGKDSSLNPEDIDAINKTIELGEKTDVEFDGVAITDTKKEKIFISFEDLSLKEQSIIKNVEKKIISDERLAGRTVDDYANMLNYLHKEYFSNAVIIRNRLDSWRRNPDVSIENASENFYKAIKDEAVGLLGQKFPKYN